MIQVTGKYPVSHVSKQFKEVLKKSGIGFIEGYLFGSRAVNENNKDSDWDYLIVIDKEINGSELRQLTGRLCIEFHKIVPNEPVDIIIQSKKSFEYNKKRLNHISNEAFTKGIII